MHDSEVLHDLKVKFVTNVAWICDAFMIKVSSLTDSLFSPGIIVSIFIQY